MLLLRRSATGLLGHAPRVHYVVDNRSRLWYRQAIQIELAVARVGEKSGRAVLAGRPAHCHGRSASR